MSVFILILKFFELLPLFLVLDLGTGILVSIIYQIDSIKNELDYESVLIAPFEEEAIYRYVPYLLTENFFVVLIFSLIWAFLHVRNEKNRKRLIKLIHFIPSAVFYTIACFTFPLFSLVYHCLYNGIIDYATQFSIKYYSKKKATKFIEPNVKKEEYVYINPLDKKINIDSENIKYNKKWIEVKRLWVCLWGILF